jgi:hypothetical protein
LLRGGLMDNRKFVRAVRMLREDLASASIVEPETALLGLLGAMWLKSANASSQQLDLLGDEMDVETRCGWRGAPGRLAKVLETCAGGGHAGFIERRDDGLLYIHDFYPNAPRHIQQRLERASEGDAESPHERRSARKLPKRTPNGDHAAATQQPNGDHAAATQQPNGDHAARKTAGWTPYQISADQIRSEQEKDTEDTEVSSGGAPPRELTPQQARVKAIEDWFTERRILSPRPGTIVAWFKHARAADAAPILEVLTSLHSRGGLRLAGPAPGSELQAFTDAGLDYVFAALRNAGEENSRRARIAQMEREDEQADRDERAAGGEVVS